LGRYAKSQVEWNVRHTFLQPWQAAIPNGKELREQILGRETKNKEETKADYLGDKEL